MNHLPSHSFSNLGMNAPMLPSLRDFRGRTNYRLYGGESRGRASTRRQMCHRVLLLWPNQFQHFKRDDIALPVEQFRRVECVRIAQSDDLV
jgi:hypothetical protein